MPLRWLRAYLVMLPRLEAEEWLRRAEVAQLPHLANASDRQRLVRRYQTIAFPPPGQEVDAQGRIVLRGSRAVRAWFAAAGIQV